MPAKSATSEIPLPRDWPSCIKSAILHVISLAQFTMAYTRGWAANSPNARIRLAAENDRLRAELALRGEQERIKDARMTQISPHRRPHFPPTERMAILQLKVARGWSLEQTAKVFLVTAATVASWMKRVDEEGPDALVQLPEPVNKYPGLVRYLVQRLKSLCPMLGKKKIAQILARAGLHLGATTVGRILQEKPHREPSITNTEITSESHVVTANYPGHVWHVDLTAMPTGLGFWCSWSPFVLPQHWPFCHWVAVAVDHFSRRVMSVAVFKSQPSSVALRAFLGRTIGKAKKAPRYIVCDRGTQFDCDDFRKWCRRKGIQKPRYGAVGESGSIAVVERFILTMKCLLACLPLIPYRRESFQRELTAIVDWYNTHRPHTWLGGKTPDEVYYGTYPANRRPRFEPRSRWPRGSSCAKPWALVKGKPGARLTLEVSFHAGGKHLPIVKLRPAA